MVSEALASSHLSSKKSGMQNVHRTAAEIKSCGVPQWLIITKRRNGAFVQSKVSVSKALFQSRVH